MAPQGTFSVQVRTSSLRYLYVSRAGSSRHRGPETVETREWSGKNTDSQMTTALIYFVIMIINFETKSTRCLCLSEKQRSFVSHFLLLFKTPQSLTLFVTRLATSKSLGAAVGVYRSCHTAWQ